MFYYKSLKNMNNHLNCKIQLVLNVHNLIKQNRIKSCLLNLLSFISTLIFCMRYTSAAPWVASALSLINSVTLGWLAYCQHANLVYLNQALVNLCERLPHPGSEEDLHQDWKPLVIYPIDLLWNWYPAKLKLQMFSWYLLRYLKENSSHNLTKASSLMTRLS